MTEQNMTRVLIRMPISVKMWLTSQTELNASSITAEVVRAILERKERIQGNIRGRKLFRP